MNDSHGKIACIGWGSLIWNPDSLALVSGWSDDGPALPVEFARQSERDKKISLVICANTPRVRTLWALLDVPGMAEAKQALATREGISNPNAKTVGFWDAATVGGHGMEHAAIAAWAAPLGLAGVVWTSLSYGFVGERGVMPRGDEIIDYLRRLKGEEQAVAEEYVRKAPAQIDTPYRRLILQTLGWDYRP